ncbi:hypothetical protein [Streptomyces umbrinus]|uniref:hypothetical protein n=1 Tax=Streptomyces umbrinus TaxID=67370 RepID=UPI0033D5B8CA
MFADRRGGHARAPGRLARRTAVLQRLEDGGPPLADESAERAGPGTRLLVL